MNGRHERAAETMRPRQTDADFMSRALRLAARGGYSAHPNPRVGCVLVRDGRVIAEGWHRQAGAPHAEIEAIRSAQESPAGACCYVTLEPCAHTGRTPPCADALLAAGVAKVVAASRDPNPLVNGKGIERLRRGGARVEIGLLAEQARTLNRGFFSRMERGRPFVVCKLAASVDGKVALRSGQSKWITSETARRDAHRLRARSSAVMIGVNTALRDDPRLDVREVEGARRQPLRVVLDRKFRLPPTARLLAAPGEAVVIGRRRRRRAMAALRRAGAAVERLEGKEDAFLHDALALLARKYEVNELLVEAGPVVTGALLARGLIDELIVYQNPCLLGADALDMIRLPTVTDLERRVELELRDETRLGVDRRLVFTLKR